MITCARCHRDLSPDEPGGRCPTCLPAPKRSNFAAVLEDATRRSIADRHAQPFAAHLEAAARARSAS